MLILRKQSDLAFAAVRLRGSTEILRSGTIFLGNLSEVIPHRRQRQSVSKIPPVRPDQLVKILPELNSCTITYPQRHYDPIERLYILDQCGTSRLDPVLMKSRQTIQSPCVILFRTVDVLQYRLKTRDESLSIHFWDKI